MPAPRPRPPILAAARVVCVAAALATGIALGCDPPNAPRTYDVPTPVKAPSHDKDTPMTEHEATQDPEDVAPGGLTTEDVARYPQPGMLQPSHLGFAPDDRFITYLRTPDASLSKQLYAFDPETGEERLLAEPPGGGETEENLSREEKLRRERQRVRGLGITRYAWSHHEAATPRMLVPMRGGMARKSLYWLITRCGFLKRQTVRMIISLEKFAGCRLKMNANLRRSATMKTIYW